MKTFYNKFYDYWLHSFTVRNILISAFNTSVINSPILQNLTNSLITFCISYTLIDLIVHLGRYLNQIWLRKFDIVSCSKLKTALATNDNYKVMDATHKIERQKMHHYGSPIQFFKDIL